MNWSNELKEFRYHLAAEKGLAENSIIAYVDDMNKLAQYLEITQNPIPLAEATTKHLRDFIAWLNEFGLATSSQARILSSLKAFYRFQIYAQKKSINPAKILSLPKASRKLPDVLSVFEIEKIISSIDLSTETGHRNCAIIETLYGCGLRVSELINLKLSNCYFDKNYIKVLGKGNVERLVPIGTKAISAIKIYIEHFRKNCKKDFEDFVFLNRRGKNLTRIMIYTIVKDLCVAAEIKKNVSPHTFRHSFATHLIDGGANLRVVQAMLGHKSIITTEIYTHISQEFIRAVIDEYHPRYGLIETRNADKNGN